MSRPVEKFSPFILACGVGLFLWAAGLTAHAADLRFAAYDRNGLLQWSNAPVPGVCTVETADTPSGPWMALKSAFATNSTYGHTISGCDQASSIRAPIEWGEISRQGIATSWTAG